MAYRKKAGLISKFYPDLIVVPECEYFEGTRKNLWFGDNRKKGIGIFSYSDFELELHEVYDPAFKYVIPIRAKGALEFNLFAIWAMNNTEDVRKRYIGQIYSAIGHYDGLLKDPIIIIGDFNWNAIWDKNPSYPLYGSLAKVVEVLNCWNIRSAYHEFFNEEFGQETRPTFFMHHCESKPYHIDYCFASSDFNICNVEIGNFNDWIKKSDHVPLIVHFEKDKEREMHNIKYEKRSLSSLYRCNRVHLTLSFGDSFQVVQLLFKLLRLLQEGPACIRRKYYAA